MKIAFEPDVPVAAFMPPPASRMNGHVRTRIRRDGMNSRETPGETTYEHFSIPDKASCGYWLREKLPDDPDEVLSAPKLYPEVVLHGPHLYSIYNRRAHCPKNHAAPRAAKI